jgi:hypothetical protein
VNTLPFRRSGPGRFYRGNLHTHSTNSDGGMTPEAVTAAYRRQGYDFVAITDHFLKTYDYPITDTTPFRADDFTTLIGAELHAPALANGLIWHLVACGLPLDFGPVQDGETGPMLAARAVEAGAFVGLAHPAWYGASVADLQSIPVAHAVEVYNEVCGSLSDRPDSWYHADALLSAGRRVTAFGADDAHFRAILSKPANDLLDDDTPAGFKAWVWVRAERLDPALLVEALKAGQYYTSQGPQIHDISLDDPAETLSVVCSPATSIFVTGLPDISGLTARHGAHLTDATFPLKAYRGSYCRVTIVDRAGKRAWSNPIWLD